MDETSGYKATQPYRYDQSRDSRSCVVPPADIRQANQRFVLQLPPNAAPEIVRHGRYGNPDFINSLARTYDLHAEYEISAWAYDNRHMAQQILPFLFLGPMSFARDPDQVRKAGFTMLVAVRSKRVAEARPKIMDPARFVSAQGVESATFDVDTPFDIISHRASILKRLNDHIEASCQGKRLEHVNQISAKILVFCETGNERSPVLPALYLMTIWGLPAFSAIQIVQARRFGVGLGPEMISMLQNVQDILNAERQVAVADKLSSAGPVTSRKRNIDQAYAIESQREDDKLESADEPFRAGNAPFIDQK